MPLCAGAPIGETGFVGLSKQEIATLIELKTAGHIPRQGAVIELGAQQLSNEFLADLAKLDELGRLYGVAGPHELPLARLEFDKDRLIQQDADSPTAEKFWQWLGYDYAAIDIDGTPGCIPLDLNYDSVPDAEVGKYQIVTNFGTTEHIANQFNAFKVIHDLTALGGVMLHNVPAQGMLTHGLVNYTHKFFWMLARSNGYQVLKLMFKGDDILYPLPDNILEASFSKATGRRLEDHQEMDCALVVVFKKTYDIAYVAPLDVPTGSRTGNDTLRNRYWTVFEADAFSSITPNEPRPKFAK
jgi:hypothetical protein